MQRDIIEEEKRRLLKKSQETYSLHLKFNLCVNIYSNCLIANQCETLQFLLMDGHYHRIRAISLSDASGIDLDLTG